MPKGKIISAKGAVAIARDVGSVMATGMVPNLSTGLGKILLAGGATWLAPKHISSTPMGKTAATVVGYLMIADGIGEMLFGGRGVVA